MAVECALGAGQVEASELTVGAGLSKDESHGPTTFPQHRVQTSMSALPPKADIQLHGRDVRFVSKADILLTAT
jgi:hypothetical protein